MAEARPSSFWDFSLEVYARPGVAPACLGLQDRLGVDVNLLLLCCWAGASGRLLSADGLAAALAAARPWQDDAVRPLRALHRRLKAGVPAVPAARLEGLRRRLADLELEAERIEQDVIAAALPAAPPRLACAPAQRAGPADAAAAVANLRGYLALLGLAPEPDDVADLTALVAACFPAGAGGALSFAACG
ncbi:MAG: TIGR02444 family protein [Dongiaceae bacterium]